MKSWPVLCLAAVVFLTTAALRADVAISIRYFKEEGTSHYHLYLYSDDGKVIRQLTAPEDAQDTLPVFVKNGEEIVFTREKNRKKKVLTIQRDGTHLREVERRRPIIHLRPWERTPALIVLPVAGIMIRYGVHAKGSSL